MGLSTFDLQQIDQGRLQALSAAQKDALILKLVRELQEALDLTVCECLLLADCELNGTAI